MKANWIVAFLAALVVAIAVVKVVTSSNSAKVEPAAKSPPAATSEASLKYKSSDMPAGTFDGMTEAQKVAVMKVMNENNCDCGCDKESLAHCVKTDPACPVSPGKLKQAVTLARAGKTSEQIQAEMFGAVKPKPSPAPRPDDTAVYKVPIEGAPVHGKASALVTMVEFSDYQCPFCSRANATVEQMESDYGDKLRVVMKQNPLPFHQNAKGAALAALAAGEQGKYWEMHQKLFANQQALDEASLEKYAHEIGLDVSRWKEAMKSPKLEQIIQQDQQLAGSLGAGGTPAFFINGRKLSGAQPAPTFKRLIDEELGKAQEMVKSGVSPEQVYAKVMEKGISTPPPHAAAPPAPPGKPPAAPAAPAAAKVAKIEIPADAPVKGPKTAKVTIVEWSDFQCPFCGRALPTLNEIDTKYGKDVRIVFRHQPLPFHQNAKPAAEAAMAANAQGKFWEYHDKLFGNQQALDRASLEKYAAEVGLNMQKFKEALDTGKYRARVEADSAAGMAVGANGTPTFFVNGRQVVGAQPFESFKPIIDEEIQKANKLIASGTKPEKVYDKLMAQAMAAAPPAGAGANPSAAPIQNIALGTAPVKGPKTAPVTIVEFSDFQCPFCGRALPTLKAIEEQYPGKIRLAFKNQPLPFHQNAKMAAQAALAANEQGKFWEYHDKLFANQQALDRSSLERYAQELGLNADKFKSALDSNKFDSQIAADMAEGNRVGANGTPTFFINGRQLVGAQPVENFKTIIDDELKKHGATGRQAVRAKH